MVPLLYCRLTSKFDVCEQRQTRLETEDWLVVWRGRSAGLGLEYDGVKVDISTVVQVEVMVPKCCQNYDFCQQASNLVVLV